jgi:adenylate cyclase
MDEKYRESLPYLFDVFGVPDAANPAPAADPEQRQKRIHAVVKQVFHDPNYASGPRVLLLEDLHWFDSASDAFLETTIESAPASHDLVLVNFRPEYQARWMQRSYYQHLPLQPLGPDAIRALLRDQLGDHPSVASLPEMIHARTKGNPFFIEEVVQTLVESGHLSGSRGAYQLTTAVEALEVPASVQAVLAARIDRLPEREKQLLQTAAVVGKTFPESLLREVVANTSRLDETTLGNALSALVAAEFLFEASLYPELEYSFKHPLTQEVALGSQLRERRAGVHAGVARALEAASGNPEERAAEIAQHWADAGESESAARYFRRAALWAGLSDVRQGLDHWRRVRELAPRVSNEAERDELALQACIKLFTLGWRMSSNTAETDAIFAEGRSLAEQSGDRATLATLVGFYGLMRMAQGSAADYVKYGEEAAVIAIESADPALRAAVQTFPAFGHFAAGSGLGALKWSARVLEETGSDNTLGKAIAGYSPRVSMLCARGRALSDLGRLREARTALADAARIAAETQELEVATWIQACFGILAHALGEPGSALEHGQRCLEIAEALDNEASRSCAYWVLGYGHLLTGNHRAALDSIDCAVDLIRRHDVQRAYLPQFLVIRAEAHLALGETKEALAAAREGVALGIDGGCTYGEAESQIALASALIATRSSSPVEIEAALTRAAELVESISARSLAPRILEVRARAAAAASDAVAAARLFAEALDVYKEIGATGYVDRLTREIEGAQ